jgi:phage nucleotide-binding protein
MTLIKKPVELTSPTKIKAMIYGQAGFGKTTLALSAPKPLLLDFDGGVHRVNFAHQCDAVQIGSWNEAIEVLKEDLSAYETIVIDTIGKMMDFITGDVEKKGASGWKKWEKINESFASFTRDLSNKGMNIIFVAHRDTRKEGDETVFIPALREKNYTSIVTELDLLGYMEVKGTSRTITFDPTSRNEGKNTCNLPGIINIPTVIDSKGVVSPNTFFQTNIIAPYVSNMRARDEQKKAFNAVMSEIKDNIDLITDEVSANDFVSRIDKFAHAGNSKAIAGQMLKAKARELSLKLSRENNKYEKAA